MNHRVTLLALTLSLAHLLFFSLVSIQADDFDTGDEMAMFFDEDELVETATRYPKPLMQVAENVSIVTAEEIAAMHYHSVAEVLNYVTGVYVSFNGQDFNSEADYSIQGAQPWHTLVLIDGVRYNNASGGSALLSGIPVQIIKRIEIIKGGASSVWGSALAGVINIITKDTGATAGPSGTLIASYGEADSLRYEGDVAGQGGPISYYLYGGRMESDGLVNGRFYESSPFYSKMRFELPEDVELTVSLGHSSPSWKQLEYPAADYIEYGRNRSTFGSLYLDIPFSKGLNLHIAAQTFRQKYMLERDVMGLGDLAGGEGAQFNDTIWDEQNDSFEARLTWLGNSLSATIGAETSRSTMDYTLAFGEEWGGPGVMEAKKAKDEKRGVYANATFSLGDFSVTPGLRYDYHSISDEFISPSLGLTYRLNDSTIIRGTMARGFSHPYLALISGGNDWEYVNPDLKPEKTLASQVGVETTALRYLRLGVNLFHHSIEDVHLMSPDYIWVNGGEVKRLGYEIEFETVSWHDLTLNANFTYAQMDSDGLEDDPTDDWKNDEQYFANIMIDYDRGKDWKIFLGGHYFWEYESEVDLRDTGNDFLWDLGASRRFSITDRNEVELFVVVQNIFNSSQHWDSDYPAAGRWFEAGFKFNY